MSMTSAPRLPRCWKRRRSMADPLELAAEAEAFVEVPRFTDDGTPINSLLGDLAACIRELVRERDEARAALANLVHVLEIDGNFTAEMCAEMERDDEMGEPCTALKAARAVLAKFIRLTHRPTTGGRT